ncbi:hypothetical protein ASPBRDRAFT_51534 [Aspergillus brasiliensis CBS 101740]|uniref:Uncharacterized protein n=1 Tax=Aspergillus brasiliensis (strain CBS 101740 / IMI 381727 / IBT 21946) TaxID=767769 RepID=A0A1L9UVT8_ASPBC|nr:hypothetical protein ASPBRDRAFT_51534 [Aspergillus brasiliensis CBS 101740]
MRLRGNRGRGDKYDRSTFQVNWSAHALSFTSDTSNSGAYRTSAPDSGPDFVIVRLCIIVATYRGTKEKLQRVMQQRQRHGSASAGGQVEHIYEERNQKRFGLKRRDNYIMIE